VKTRVIFGTLMQVSLSKSTRHSSPPFVIFFNFVKKENDQAKLGEEWWGFCPTPQNCGRGLLITFRKS
jgi:hypothetical protein